MKRVILICMICAGFCVGSAGFSEADDLASLKEQIKAMQDQLRSQMDIINKQNEQIGVMQGRITHLEGKGVSEFKSAPESKKDKNALHVKWKNGLKVYDDEKNFDIGIGGRLQMDAAYMKEDGGVKTSVGDLKDSAEVRRARLYTSGTIYKDYLYKFQIDFAGSDYSFKDMYVGMRNLPYAGTIKVGHFNEPFCLNRMTSNKYITFMERALPDAFSPSRNLGVRVNNTAFDERMTWAAGIFFETDSHVRAQSNDMNFSLRTTGLPYYEEDGKKLLHLGFSYSFRNPEETIGYRQRPEAHLAPYFVNTGDIAAKHANQLGYEVAGVYGPFSAQAEFIHSYVRKTTGPMYAHFYGMYGQVSYFITGESRPYKKSTGTFTRVIPKNNFSIKDDTYGAWEIAARFSHLDLNDTDVRGGIMSDVTLGLNWYLNPNMKIMGNYIHSHLNGQGNADMFTTRFQVDF